MGDCEEVIVEQESAVGHLARYLEDSTCRQVESGGWGFYLQEDGGL